MVLFNVDPTSLSVAVGLKLAHDSATNRNDARQVVAAVHAMDDDDAGRKIQNPDLLSLFRIMHSYALGLIRLIEFPSYSHA